MKKVLIIEDDKVLSEMYALKLKKSGFEVKEAENGLIGLTTISEFDPDVILLDLMMPTMNGFETLYSIKNQTSSKSKIIVFTNIIDKEKIEEAKAYGVDDYLVKANVDPSDVIATINKVLGQKYDEQEKVEPIRINPGLNIFKLKNPVSEEDIEISVNVKI